MSWQEIAERAAARRSAAIVARIEAAIAEHAPDSAVEREGSGLRVRARALRQRWLSEAGLRFARVARR